MMTSTVDRDRRIAELSEQLIEIEERLIPTGLHVFGRAPQADGRADLLRMVGSFDRPEQGARALTKLVAESLGIESYDDLLQQEPTSESRELIDGIVKGAIAQLCESGVDAACGSLKSRANVAGELSRPT